VEENTEQEAAERRKICCPMAKPLSPGHSSDFSNTNYKNSNLV
jgi:hypothetical protein